MIDVKKHEQALATAQRRKAELSKSLAPHKKAHEQAQAEHDALQRQLMALRERLRDFEALELELSDEEYLAGRARVDLLNVKCKRAADKAGAARKALDTAQTEASAEISRLRGAAINAWRTDVTQAEENYFKAWNAL